MENSSHRTVVSVGKEAAFWLGRIAGDLRKKKGDFWGRDYFYKHQQIRTSGKGFNSNDARKQFLCKTGSRDSLTTGEFVQRWIYVTSSRMPPRPSQVHPDTATQPLHLGQGPQLPCAKWVPMRGLLLLLQSDFPLLLHKWHIYCRKSFKHR